MPSPWDRPREALAARLDVAFRDALLVRKPRRPRPAAAAIASCERLLDAAPFAEWSAAPEPFFGPVAPTGIRRHALPSAWADAVVDLRFRSEHPLVFEALRDTISQQAYNHEARARLFLHADRARPAVMLVHGYFGGAFAFEERFWGARALYERGLNVALYVLPFHGARRGGGPLSPPAWPHGDYRRTLEGFRQAIIELRCLRALLAAEGASSVGAMGMSLGGYTTGLLAAAEPQLAFVAPLIPLASFADFYRANGQLPGDADEQARLYELLERLHAPISPLARPVLVPEGARMVLAGRHDRITPPSHAQRMAAHFGVEPTLFPGAHLLQFGRGQALDALFTTLAAEGLLAARGAAQT